MRLNSYCHGVRRATYGLLIALFAGFIAASARGDALSQLPELWKNRLQQLPEVDMTGAESYARESIRESWPNSTTSCQMIQAPGSLQGVWPSGRPLSGL